MRKIYSLLTIATLVVALGAVLAVNAIAAEWRVLEDSRWCNDSRWGDEADVCEVREIMLDKRDQVQVDAGPNGGIKVEGWDKNQIRLRVKVRVWSRDDDEAREIADDIEIITDGRVIRAEGPKMRGRHRGWSVSYRLMVPKKSDLNLETTNGGITVNDVEGEIAMEATNGGLSLSGLAGDVHGRTTNGGLDVELGGSQWRGEGMDVRSTNGGVSLSIPEDYSADLEMGTVNGQIHLGFPLTLQGKIGKNIRTKLGKGGPLVRIKTTNGGVRVDKS